MSIALPISVIGLSNSGKTSIVHSLMNSYKEIYPTAGFEINYITSFSKTVLAYDCSGQGHSASNWTMISNLVDCVVFVIDSADKDSFSVAKRYLMRFVEMNKFMREKNLCIMLNKCDVKDRAPKEVFFKALETEKLAKVTRNVYVKQTSAYNKQGLEQCIDWIIKNSLNEEQQKK